MNSVNPVVSIGLIVILGVAGLFFIFVVMPFLGRVLGVFEAITLLMQGISEYTGNPLLTWLGCFAVVAILASCCLIPVVGTAIVLTCRSGNPSYFCNLIAR